MKLIDLLKNSAQNEPQTTAVKSEETNLTYRQLLTYVNRTAEHLKSIVARKGANIAIILGNCPEFFIAFFAVSAADATVLPLSPAMTTYESLFFLKRADVSIVLTNEKYSRLLLNDKNRQKTKNLTIINIKYFRNSILKIRTEAKAQCPINKQTENVALMVHTSGTTGKPKLVMLTDSQLISNMFLYSSLMNFKQKNIVYCSLLLHHIYCICAQLLTHIYRTDTFILRNKPFFIKEFINQVHDNNVTITAFVPYMAILLAEVKNQKKKLQSLKYVTLSGAKTPKATYETLTKKFPHINFINTYGMSEAGSRIAIAAPFPKNFPVESVGKPMPGVDVRIVDDNHNLLPPNTTGQIQVRSSGVAKGYYKQPKLTEKTIKNNWLNTGDIGKLDKKQNLFIIGRKKDIIISGANNLYPSEIEQILIEHPAVSQAVVVPKKDQRLQEIPVAFIVTKSHKNIETHELIAFCRKKLSTFKIPRLIKTIRKIPKLDTSKINRKKLKKMADNL